MTSLSNEAQLFRLNLQIPCVMVPTGQKTHQDRGLKNSMVMMPRMKDVNIIE